MREIKCRAWNEAEKKFVYATLENGTINVPPRSEVRRSGYGEDFVSFYNLSPWEQYTGLKDKNGNKIYEGDIVVSGTDDPQDMDVVVYQAPSFVMKRKPHHKTWRTFVLHPDENQFQEIIGNIHQNPELLETTNE